MTTGYKLFLDDIRIPEDVDFRTEDFVIVRSFYDAVDYVTEHGVPDYVAFDHDLGDEHTGKDFADWLVVGELEGVHTIPDHFTFSVHSANPVGAENIRAYLNNYLKMRKEPKEVEPTPEAEDRTPNSPF